MDGINALKDAAGRARDNFNEAHPDAAENIKKGATEAGKKIKDTADEIKTGLSDAAKAASQEEGGIKEKTEAATKAINKKAVIFLVAAVIVIILIISAGGGGTSESGGTPECRTASEKRATELAMKYYINIVNDVSCEFADSGEHLGCKYETYIVRIKGSNDNLSFVVSGYIDNGKWVNCYTSDPQNYKYKLTSADKEEVQGRIGAIKALDALKNYNK